MTGSRQIDLEIHPGRPQTGSGSFMPWYRTMTPAQSAQLKIGQRVAWHNIADEPGIWGRGESTPTGLRDPGRELRV